MKILVTQIAWLAVCTVIYTVADAPSHTVLANVLSYVVAFAGIIAIPLLFQQKKADHLH
jgi:hypothetical protein